MLKKMKEKSLMPQLIYTAGPEVGGNSSSHQIYIEFCTLLKSCKNMTLLV